MDTEPAWRLTQQLSALRCASAKGTTPRTLRQKRCRPRCKTTARRPTVGAVRYTACCAISVYDLLRRKYKLPTVIDLVPICENQRGARTPDAQSMRRAVAFLAEKRAR